MLIEWYLRRQFQRSPELAEHLRDWQAAVALAQLEQLIVPSTAFYYAGQPVVRQFFAVQDQTLATKQRVLQLAGSLASHSQQEVLAPLVVAAKEAGETLREVEVDELAEIGVTGKLDRTWYVLGDEACMQQEQIELGVTIQTLAQQFEVDGKYTLFLAQRQPKRLLGIFACEYQVNPTVADTAEALQRLGCEMVLLTGTKTSIARGIGRQIGISLIHSELGAREKQRIIATLLKQNPQSMVLLLPDMECAPSIPALRIGEDNRDTLGWEKSLEALPQRIAQARHLVNRAQKTLFWCKLKV